MIASAPSRIVVVSSMAHENPYEPEGIRFDQWTTDTGYSEMMAYGQSKLANVLMAKALARRLEGRRVFTNVCHPGVIVTELQRHLEDKLTAMGTLGSFIRCVGFGYLPPPPPPPQAAPFRRRRCTQRRTKVSTYRSQAISLTLAQVLRNRHSSIPLFHHPCPPSSIVACVCCSDGGPDGASSFVALNTPWLCTQTIWTFISLGIIDRCANSVGFRGSVPLLPHLCPLRGGYVGCIRKALEKGHLEHPGLHAVLAICLRFSSVLDDACVAHCLVLSTGSYHVRIQMHTQRCCIPRF